jgi:hypothetical protein
MVTRKKHSQSFQVHEMKVKTKNTKYHENQKIKD